jgi:hypothetical protein
MKYAFNNNGVLQDVVMTHPSILFVPSYAEKFIEVPDDAQNGWFWDGATASPPPKPVVTPEQIRADRNDRLAQTDWTQAADVPQATRDKWAPYRQALRDVPQQAGFPDNIQWPSKPE